MLGFGAGPDGEPMQQHGRGEPVDVDGIAGRQGREGGSEGDSGPPFDVPGGRTGGCAVGCAERACERSAGPRGAGPAREAARAAEPRA